MHNGSNIYKSLINQLHQINSLMQIVMTEVLEVSRESVSKETLTFRFKTNNIFGHTRGTTDVFILY